MTVKVKGVVPLRPSRCTAVVPAMARLAVLFRTRPVAVAPVMVRPVDGEARVRVNVSSASTRLSAATLTVMTLLVSPAAKLMVPAGSVPPRKSAALAGEAPLPVTDQATVALVVTKPARVAVKVKGVEPEMPSRRLALVAATETVAPVAPPVG